MKKFFIVLTSLFFVFLVFFLIYNFFFKNNPFEGKVSPGGSNTRVEFGKDEGPTKKESIEKITALTEQEVTLPVLDADSRSVLYVSKDERAVKQRFLLEETVKTLIEFPFPPRGIVWSNARDKALVEKEPSEWFLLVRESKELLPLPEGIEFPAWTTLGDRIIYHYTDLGTGERTVNIAAPDGTGWEKIGTTPFDRLTISAVPQSARIAFWNAPNAFEKTSLHVFSAMATEPTEVFSGMYGTDYLFSPRGGETLVSGVTQSEGTVLTLGLIDLDGSNYRNLFIPSLVGKAVWSRNGRFVYYALPGTLPQGSILPNDYYEKPILTADTFWKVDVETGEKSRVVDTKDIIQSFDAESLMIDAEETSLFFRNRRDGKLYRVSLSL